MIDYKSILGLIASVSILAGTIPYVASIIRRTVRPHIFSWLAWAIIQGTVFGIQLVEGGGAGSWPAGVGSGICLLVFILALRQSHHQLLLTDWIALIGSIAALGLWIVSDQPLVATILLSSADVLGYIPTLRKGYLKPREDGFAPFISGAVASGLAILALGSYSLTTWLYPAVIVVSNLTFVVMVSIRRKTTTTRKVG